MDFKQIKLPFRMKKAVLALGSQTKNTVCLAKDNFAYLSPLHADLNNPQDFLMFEKDTRYFFKKNPKIIACDLHPEYQSTEYAQDLQLTTYNLQLIQHHHAHIASCMADNRLQNQKVIGVAFDGTGLGDDSTLWGAEFLICDYSRYKRTAHLKYIPLIGGDQAIRQPWRITIFWLYLIYKERLLDLRIDFARKINKKKWIVLKRMYDSNFNCPLASSMGRLFDAVASLVLAKPKADFEAELAIELEKKVWGLRQKAEGYKFKIVKDKDKYILDPLPMFKEIIADLKTKQAKEKIAYRFHLTVAEMIKKTCLILRKETGLNTVVLSGGVFQNKILLNLSLDLLYKDDFKVFLHRDLSCNDSGISLGQAVIANQMKPRLMESKTT